MTGFSESQYDTPSLPPYPGHLTEGQRVRITGDVVELQSEWLYDVEVTRKDLVGMLATVTQVSPFISYSYAAYLYHLKVDGLGQGYSAARSSFELL